MDIPTTAAGVLVIVLAVLPGLPGDYVYRTWVGVTWRERDVHHLLRLLSFSLLGLVVYSICAPALRLPLPEYVIPSTFTEASFSARRMPVLGIAYLGHFVGSALAGTCVAGGLRLIWRLVPTALRRDTWDHFVWCSVPGHWVVVTLQNGDSYAGMIERADVTVEPQYRDLILSEPYLFDVAAAQYRPTYHQYLFLKGTEVTSLAAVYTPKLDTRVVPAADSPFHQE